MLATIDLGVLLVFTEAGLIEQINLLLDIAIFEVSIITNKDKQALDTCDATCSDSDCGVDLCDDDNDPTDPYEGSASDQKFRTVSQLLSQLPGIKIIFPVMCHL